MKHGSWDCPCIRADDPLVSTSFFCTVETNGSERSKTPPSSLFREHQQRAKNPIDLLLAVDFGADMDLQGPKNPTRNLWSTMYCTLLYSAVL